jgi:pre-rRNA-processing protein TSR4
VDEDEQEEAKQDLRSQDPRVREFGAFTARLARAPAQCIRYVFDSGASPLWAHRSGRAPHPVAPCPLCGGPRRFEIQLMPQSLHFLGVDSSLDDAPDFATVAIYTCAASCPIWPAREHRNSSAEREAGAVRQGGGGGQVGGEKGSGGAGGWGGGWAGLGAPPCVAAGEVMVGRRVRVTGLQARPELNGRIGTVLGWHPQSERWAVELSGTEVGMPEGSAATVADGEGTSCEGRCCEHTSSEGGARRRANAVLPSGGADSIPSGSSASGHVGAGSIGDGSGSCVGGCVTTGAVIHGVGGGACGGAASGAAEVPQERLRLRGANLESVEGPDEPALGGYAEEYVWVQLPEC